MMKRVRFYVLLMSVIWFNASEGIIAQPAYHKLKPGEKVPDVTFSILKNDSYTEAKLSDFKGKLVILDYWSTWCSSCLKAFPGLESIQNKFASDIVILPVSFLHKKQFVKDFIKNRKGTEHGINLPLAVFENTDNILFQSLPTMVYPHEVWIDKNGHFIKASDAYDVTEENVLKAMKDGTLNFVSANSQMDFNRHKPLLTNNNGGPDTAFIYRSLITRYIDSISSGNFSGEPNKSVTRLSYLNTSALELLKVSLYKGFSSDVFNKRVIIEGGSTLGSRLGFKDVNQKDRVWKEKHLYCYDLTLPSYFTRDRAFELMHTDINRFFNVKSTFEKRELACLVLKRTDLADRLQAKSTRPETLQLKNELEIRHQKLTVFLSSLSGIGTPIILDETGYSKNIDIKISFREGEEILSLNRQLSNYGLKLEEAQREFDVIVIKESE